MNALDTIQLKVIPYNEDWNTGISVPVLKVTEQDSIFPIQEYDWDSLQQKVKQYVDIVTACN